jgi:tetratricopeptide (TPR) repeat protein
VFVDRNPQLAREIDDRPMLAMALASQGIGELYSGDPETALALFEEQDDKYTLTFFKSDLAHALRQQGDLNEALRFYCQSIRKWQEFGHRAAVAHQLECFALIASAQNHFTRAAILLSSAEALRIASHSLRTHPRHPLNQCNPRSLLFYLKELYSHCLDVVLVLSVFQENLDVSANRLWCHLGGILK